MKTRYSIAIVLVGLIVCSGGTADAQTQRQVQRQTPQLNLYAPTPAAVQDLQAIMDALQVRFPIVFAAGDVPNAQATIARDDYGRPVAVVMYNRAFMNQLAAVDPWAPISVLAHEVGHLIGGHPVSQGPEHPWSHEIEADRVSGCALALLGASPEAATTAQMVYFDAIGSSSHPRTRLRLHAILEGWQSCRR